MKKIAFLMLTSILLTGKTFAQSNPVRSKLSDITYQQKGDLKLWPNPAKDHIRVRINDDRITTLEVTDQSGKKLIQQPMAKDGKVDVSKLSPGVYILAARGTVKSYSKKFLIAR